jgi:Protein of unknown function (DUF3027)
MKEIYELDAFADSCHERWSTKNNRDLSLSDPPDEWIESQCEICVYWIPLRGKFATDWGVCSNEKSTSDGVVRFSHDGCDHFEERPKTSTPTI